MKKKGEEGEFFPPEKEAISCSVCGATNFRKCKCPWDKPFQTWPPQFAFIKELNWPDDEN